MIRRCIANIALGALIPAACGGGGGSSPPPLTSPARLVIGGADVEAGAAGGLLEVAIAAESGAPTMVQFDLVYDPAQLALRAEVEAIAAIGDFDAALVGPGRLRLVFGDASSRVAPRPLSVGALLRVPFDVVPGARPGVVEIRAERAVASGPNGEPFDFAEAAVATVTLR